MKYTSTRDAFKGPPFVVTATCSNTWNEKIIDIIRTKKVVGLKMGRVIEKKRLTGPAPSISAAS